MSQIHAVSESKLVLRYWNCAGRGMLMRYMAYDADLDFIDDLVDIDEDFLGGTWESTKKFLPELAGPFKALPVVQHLGATINETGACSQYVAEIAGYMPKSPLDRAKVIMISDHIYEDILINISYALWGFRDWDRDVIGGFAGPTSGLPLKFSNLEDILVNSASGFAVGSEVSMADFAIFYIVDILTQRMLEVESGPAAVELLFGSKPALAKHQKMMSTRPNMSKYRSSAQWKLYGPYLSGKGVMGERTHELELGDTELEGIEILASKLVACLT